MGQFKLICMQARKIIHIDMDAFYASVEQRDYPHLCGQAVVVGGSPQSRGVVCAASYEARVYGVRSAMSCAKAYKLCPHAHFVSPRFERYQEASQQLNDIFHRYTDIIEPLSLDEGFLDVTENKLDIPSATWIAQEIRQRIQSEMQLTASAGVSNCKFIAKIASDFHKPNGLCVVTPSQIEDFLSMLPVRKVPGIGQASERQLHGLGIRTIYDLRQLSISECLYHFGNQGQRYYDLARGIDQRPVCLPSQRISIGVEHTFASNLHDLEHINNELKRLSNELAQRLDKRHAHSHELCLKVKYSDFKTYSHQRFIYQDLYQASNIFELAQQLFHESIDEQQDIRLLGLAAGQLDYSGAKQQQFLVAESTQAYSAHAQSS